MRPAELVTQDKYGAQSLTDNQLLAQPAGYGILSGGAVTSSPKSYSITATQTTAQFGVTVGSDGGITQTTVTADADNFDLLRYVDDQDPRKVVLCVSQSQGKMVLRPDSPDGPAVGEAGSAEPAIPEGNTHWKTERPAPVDLHADPDVVPVASIWVGANATKIADTDIRNRRLMPAVDAAHVHAGEIRFGEIIDGAGVSHTGELADRTDIPTEAETRQRINTDPDHGATANHNYYTDADTLSIVNAQDVLSVSISGRADSVDGYHASELSKIGHNHDNRYIEDGNAEVTLSNLNFDPLTQSEYQASLPDTLATGTTTGTGGNSPAAVVTATNVSNDVTADLTADVTVASNPGLSVPFGHSYAWEQTWNSGSYDVEIVITWSENPGNGNDVSFDWIVEQEDR